MTNEHNESKLVDKLEFKGDEGAYTKDQLTIRLLELGPTLKGLKYNYYRKSKKKCFTLFYWHKNSDCNMTVIPFKLLSFAKMTLLVYKDSRS